jgi:nicotinate-nucleotide adenylyltransferase
MGVRLGVMGGTFDPIHHAHLVNASEVAHHLGLDQVVFVPSGRPQRKVPIASAEQRLTMTVAATAVHPRFSVSRMEIDRPGPAYTVRTLRELRARLGSDDELFFIAGADVLGHLATWREHEALADLAHFVFCSRAGYRWMDPGLPAERVTLLNVPRWDISSTLIRHRVRRGRPIRYLVPDRVAELVVAHRLYRWIPADA